MANTSGRCKGKTYQKAAAKFGKYGARSMIFGGYHKQNKQTLSVQTTKKQQTGMNAKECGREL